MLCREKKGFITLTTVIVKKTHSPREKLTEQSIGKDKLFLALSKSQIEY